ncbi:MAG: phosphotransferase family protein [Nevskiales bacterium]
MDATLHADLQSALHRHCGTDHQLLSCQRLTAGASAETYAVDIRRNNQELALILRRSAAGSPSLGVNVDKHTEALVQMVAAKQGVPAPRVLFILDEADNLGEGYVMQRVTGETLPKRILGDSQYAEAREKLTEQCAAALANIHSIPTEALPELALLPATPQLKQIERLYRGSPLASPVFELAFRWLANNLPPEGPDMRLVHGDFRNGNLLIDESGLRLILDWELTHVGNPLEDLGWLCVNAWRFGQRNKPVGGFGKREALCRAYEKAGGIAVDPAQLRFWEIFGTLKWGVICIMQTMLHLSGAVPSVERAVIGRRVSETELDILDLLEGCDA